MYIKTQRVFAQENKDQVSSKKDSSKKKLLEVI